MPARLKVSKVVVGEEYHTEMHTVNYGAAAMTPPVLRAAEKWIVLGNAQVTDGPQVDAAATQQWTVPVTVKAGSLGEGIHEGHIDRHPPGGGGMGGVTVEACVVPAIAVSPRQLFFGQVRPGESKTITLVIKLNKSTVEDVRMDHDLGTKLKMVRRSGMASTAVWDATLTAGGGVSEVRGRAIISCGNGGVRTEVPVIGRIGDESGR